MAGKVNNLIARGLYYTAFALSVLSALGVTAMVGLIVTSVVMRKIVNAPLFFSEELVGLLMSVSLLLALPMVTYMNHHVRVTIVTTYVAERHRARLALLAALTGIAFCAWMLVEAVPWLEFAIRLNLMTETSKIPLVPWMAILPLSLVVTGLIFVAQLFGLVDQSEEDPSEYSE